MAPTYTEEVTTKSPLFASIPFGYILAAAPLAVTIPTLSISLLTSLLATRRLSRSSGALSLILLRTRLALHAATAIAAAPTLALAFAHSWSLASVNRFVCSLTFLVETVSNGFLVYQTLAVLATISFHVLGIVRRLEHSLSKYSSLWRVEVDLQLQKCKPSIIDSRAFLRSIVSDGPSARTRTRIIAITFGPALIAIAVVLLAMYLFHGFVDSPLGHWADCETVDLSPNENSMCTLTSKLPKASQYEYLNETFIHWRKSALSINSSASFLHVLHTTPLVTSSMSLIYTHSKNPKFSLNICIPVSALLALMRITLILLVPCLLACGLVALLCCSNMRLQSLLKRPKTEGDLEVLTGIATRYTGDSRPAKWCAFTGFGTCRQPPDKGFDYSQSSSDPNAKTNSKENGRAPVASKTEETGRSNEGPWVPRQRVQLTLPERTFTNDTNSIARLPSKRHLQFKADESDSNRPSNRKIKAIHVKGRIVRTRPQEPPLAVSIRRNHSSFNREKPAKGTHIGLVTVSELRALRSNLLYLTVLILLLSPSYVLSAAILISREFFVFPDPMSYPQFDIQLHPVVHSLWVREESQFRFIFCWLNDSPVTFFTLYIFHLLATAIAAFLILLLLLSQERSLAHALRGFFKAPIAFYRESSPDLNARLHLRYGSLYGSHYGSSRYGSFHASSYGSSGARRRRFSALLEFDSVVRSPLFGMQLDHSSEVVCSPILDYGGVPDA